MKNKLKELPTKEDWKESALLWQARTREEAAKVTMAERTAAHFFRNLIQSEINWHSRNRLAKITPEYRRGFVKGLRHAKMLIKQGTPYLLLFLLAGMMGCDSTRSLRHRPDIAAGDCSDHFHDAVMERAMRSVPYHFNSVDANWMGTTDEKINEEQEAIEKLFAWSKTLPNSEERSCWENWLGYYQYDLDRARSERDKHAKAAEFSATHKYSDPPKELQ